MRHNFSLKPLISLCLLLLMSTGPAAASPAFDLAAYNGKVVIVDFWASWCVPCRRSFPWMNEMQQKYGPDGLVIVGINMDTDAAAAARFLAETPAGFEIRYDAEGSLAKRFDVIAMPSSYLFDRTGKQVLRHLGFKVRNQDEYEAAIREALQ